ncbi:hypothetical protein ACEWY4_004027 [Coilia grayii]|uniref:non-specific serine/threonine protein kinase n=1 Tax=Coilia grayii TaxID=363190 RepID=A0ABD1KLB3_9TELE
MNDMTDTNDRQEDEYEYEYSDYGWIRRLKAATVTCSPVTGLEPNNVTGGLTTTMTSGHPDTTANVPAADNTCLTQPHSTLTDRRASCDTADDFILISSQANICRDPTNPPSETGIVSTPHVTESDMAALPTGGVVDPFAPVVTSNKDPINSPTESSTVLGALPMDCFTPPVHCFVDSLSTSLDISTGSINPEANSTLNILNDPEESSMEVISFSDINLIPDTTPELVVDEQSLETVSSLTDKLEDTEEDDRQKGIKCDSLLLSPATTDLLAKEFQFQCSPDVREECGGVSEGERWTQLETCDSGKVEEDRHKYSEKHYLGQPSETINNKQKDTVEDDMDTWIKCDPLTVSQATTDVVAEELQFRCSPDVREEVRVVSDGERWTQLETCDSGSTGDDGKHGHIEKHYSDQHLESQAPEETHGYQEGNIEGSCVASGDTYDVLKPLRGLSTEDQGVSLECEAKVEQKDSGYSDPHLLVQTAANFKVKAAKISSEGETEKDNHTSPVQCSVDSPSISLGISTDNLNPHTDNNLNPGESNVEPILCSAVNLPPDTISELVVDVQNLTIVSNLTDEKDDTVEDDLEKFMECDSFLLTQAIAHVVTEELQVQCSPEVKEEVKVVSEGERFTTDEVDEEFQFQSSTSLSTSTDNIHPVTNNNLGDPEESNIEPISCSAVNLTPDTISELVFDGQHLPTVCNLSDKQEDTGEGAIEKCIKWDSFLLTQAIADVVTEELQVQRSPDAKEEVRVVSEGERFTQLVSYYSGSAEEEGQQRYFENNYSDQPLENVTDKQEDTVEGDIGMDIHPLTYNVQNPVTESHPLIRSGNWDQSETDQDQAAALGDLADVSTRKEEGVGFKSADYDSSSNESWLDACQFLALEENGASIFDEWGHSPSVSSCDESTHGTKDLSATGGTVATTLAEPISHSALRGPPVERWSSTDSWVSALSDWAPALSSHHEDPFICESLTEASMAIQDQAVAPSPDGSTQSGEMVTALPQNLLALGGHQSAEVRADVDVDPRGRTSDPVACCCLLEPSEKTTALSNDMGAACDTFSARESFTHQSDCPRNSLYGDSYRTQTEPFTDLYHKVQSSIQLPYNDNGQQYVKAGTTPWGVREDGVSLPVLSTEEKGERSYGFLTISDYLSGAAPAEEHSVFAPFLATDTGSLTCSLDQGDSQEEVYSQENTGSLLQGEKSGFPQFIMPFAPVGQPSLGNSAQRLISCSLPGDQPGAGGLAKDPQSWTNSVGSTFPSLLPPYVHSHLKIHPLLPAVKDIGECLTGELRSPSDTTDTSTSWDSSSASSTSSSSEDQVVPGDSCSVDQQSIRKASDVRKECDNLLIATGERYQVLEQDRVACLTLDVDSRPYPSQCAEGQEDNFVDSSNTANPRNEKEWRKSSKMPHKTSKAASEGKGRSKHKDKSGGHHSTTHVSKKQENVHPESQSGSVLATVSSEDKPVTVIETIVITEKVAPKSHGKKKKKHHQAPAAGKSEVVPLAEVENGAKQKTAKEKVSNVEAAAHVDSVKQKATGEKAKIDSFEVKLAQRKGLDKADSKKDNLLSETLPVPRSLDEGTGKIDSRTNDSVSADKHGVIQHKKAYSDVVKEKSEAPKPGPQVVEDILAVPVPDDPQSISLKCQFGTIAANATVTWTKGKTVLSEIQKSAGDVSQESLTLLKACSKDLGMYRCTLTCSFGSAYSDFHFTSEVLCELVIPSHTNEVEPTEVLGDEENVQCAPLLFKDDFLSEQYFGEHQPASITTEKEHFGEGMHRKAFRATLKAGALSDLSPGHPCVLKVHNSVSHGTNTIEELVQRNYNLAVEECHVQNTAREYIKAYNNVAKSAESFGELPEIIPIFLVHRPSNDIPYATLEEELRGDFVKYSVKDGKEINLMRRDSEAGQKCCAFQHWVYTITEGNLLVTDMQGVGMKLTDVGIATCKKGYKGFRGNCATSFIDQFKVLHQCNRYCELLGLESLQPKPKRMAPPAKPKPQPAPKKKTFGPPLKGKS